MTIVLRSGLPPDRIVAGLREEIRRIDPEIPLADVRAMTEVMALSVADRRLHVLLIGTFGLLAIVLATVGVYGVVAYDVLQRTREIGIRVALGASRGSVLALMLRQGMRLVLMGGAAGLVLAAVTMGVATSILFEVQPRDGAVFAGVALVLAVAGAVATYVPARRATRLDPLACLRTD